MNPLTPSPSDTSVQLLNKIFGAGWNTLFSSGSGAPSFFGAILSVYDTILFAVLGVIVLYSLLVGIAEASQEGVPLGKRYSRWMPFRIVTAAGFLAPMPAAGGLSLAQAAVLGIVSMSVGFADNVWTAGVTYLVKSGPAVVMNVNSGSTLVKDVLESLVCEDWANSQLTFIGNGTQYEMTDPANPYTPPLPLPPLPGSLIRQNTISQTVTTSSASGPAFGVGQSLGFSTPTTTGLQKSGISFDGAPNSGLPPGACGSFVFTFPQNQTVGITSIATAQETALSQMIATLSPVAAAIVNNQPPPQAPLITAANQYQGALTSAATSVMSQGANGAELAAWQSNATTAGWLTAGSFYWSFSKINQELSTLMNEHWIYSGIAVSALPDTGGVYGLKNLIAGTAVYTNGLEQAAAISGGNAPGSAALAASAQNIGNGSSLVSKFLTLLSSPVTGLVDAFANALSQNGDPVLEAQSFGNTVIDATEAAIVGSVGTMAMGAGVGNSWVAQASAKTGFDLAKAIQIASMYLAPFLLALSLPLLCFGALLAYLLPAVPFVVWTLGVIAWMILILEALVAVPIWGILHASPEGDGFLPGTVRNGYLLLLDLFVRPALMVIGFFAGFVVLEALALLIDQGFSVMVAGVTAGHLTGIVGFIALLGVLAGLLTTAAWKSFHLVIWFPEHVLRWIGHSGSPMSTEGESRGSHATVVAAVSGGTKSVEKLGQTSQGKAPPPGSAGSAANHPGDAPVQGQGKGDSKG
jgi:conjugal transfer/type IV secretion protein DotA/TraY